VRRALALVLAVTIIALAGCGGGDHPTRRGATATATPGAGAGATAAPGAAATPAPDLSTPHGIAAALTAAHRETARAVDAWRSRPGGTRRGDAPPAVERPARAAQRLYRRLATRPRLARNVLRRIDDRATREEARDVIAAQAALHVLNAPQRTAAARRAIRLQPAEPAAALLDHYREGERRSGVPWSLLAAVNLVESDFGRLRNDSIAGAQGPMQFIPSTWATYGGGGDVQDPRDAILGAARFLAAGGAPSDVGRALYSYNPSRLYVEAVSRYARRIAADPRAFYAFYAWRAPVPRRLTS
jgi:membrane-bound lytic murein transglycosylase B